MENNKENIHEEFTKDIIDLVIARLNTVPSNATLHVGEKDEELTTEGLKEHVRKQTQIGRDIIEKQLFFLRSLKDLPLQENVSIGH